MKVPPPHNSKGRRVSVFENTNGCNFLPGTMQPDTKLENALQIVRDHLGCDELHITGGEPTLHPRLDEIVRNAKDRGLKVKLTSNGEGGAGVIKKCAEYGLDGINFSIFGTTPEDFLQTQNRPPTDVEWAEQKLLLLHQSIGAAITAGLDVSLNFVINDKRQFLAINDVIDKYGDGTKIRLLDDLGDKRSSELIEDFLASVDAVPIEKKIKIGVSGQVVKYRLPDGKEIFSKQIRPVALEDICDSCEKMQDCREGYYGPRLYVDDGGQYKIGICIQRMDAVVDIEDFADSGIVRSIMAARQHDDNAHTIINERREG